MNHAPNKSARDQSALGESGLPQGYAYRDDWEITPRQVKAMLDAGEDFLLLDCRTHGEHRTARIEGATLLPLQEIESRFGELASHTDKQVVVFCHHGMRSLRMTMMLRQNGFHDVRSMAGGIDTWSQDIDPMVPRY